MLLKQEDFANDEEFEECVSTSCVYSSIYGEPVCQFMNRKRAEGKPYRVSMYIFAMLASPWRA